MTPGGLRPLLGILLGAIVGAGVYGVSRGLLPGRMALGAALVGVLTGVGARVAGAIGSPAQLRVMVFSSLFAVLIGEYAAYGMEAHFPDLDGFAAHLLDDGVWLGFTILFMVGGIFLGVRLLVGGDPLAQVVEHAGDAIPPGATGTPCPRCDSVQTLRDPKTHELHCGQCGHDFRAG